jgi:hypothetical protein
VTGITAVFFEVANKTTNQLFNRIIIKVNNGYSSCNVECCRGSEVYLI